MRWLLEAIAAAVALSVMFHGAAFAKAKTTRKAAAPCVAESAMSSLNVRALQTELMVAALSCDETERYNAFVESRQDELSMYGQRLRATLKGRTNAFVTKVANVSALNMDCAASRGLFVTVLSADQPQLDTIATTEWASKLHGYRVCTKR